MSFLHKLLESLHHRLEVEEVGETNLRAEDGFVPASRLRTRGFVRIF